MGLEGTKVAGPGDTRAQNRYLKTLSRERAYSQEALKRMFQKLEQITFHWMWETLGVEEQQGEREDLLGKALQTTSKTQTVANSPASVRPSFSPLVFLAGKLFALGRCLLLPVLDLTSSNIMWRFYFSPNQEIVLWGKRKGSVLRHFCLPRGRIFIPGGHTI